MKACNHCYGTGTCKEYPFKDMKLWGIIPYILKTSCYTCCKKQDLNFAEGYIVTCSVCGGKGWIK